jgi:hypothetical protein
MARKTAAAGRWALAAEKQINFTTFHATETAKRGLARQAFFQLVG